eukprot:1979845-Rhodomonas_salina.1
MTQKDEYEKRGRGDPDKREHTPSILDAAGTGWMKKSLGTWMGSGDAKEEVLRLREELAAVKEELSAKAEENEKLHVRLFEISREVAAETSREVAAGYAIGGTDVPSSGFREAWRGRRWPRAGQSSREVKPTIFRRLHFAISGPDIACGGTGKRENRSLSSALQTHTKVSPSSSLSLSLSLSLSPLCTLPLSPRFLLSPVFSRLCPLSLFLFLFLAHSLSLTRSLYPRASALLQRASFRFRFLCALRSPPRPSSTHSDSVLTQGLSDLDSKIASMDGGVTGLSSSQPLLDAETTVPDVLPTVFPSK